MKIAVVSETSAVDRNADIVAALQDRGHRVINAGMKRGGEEPELQYIHTGLIAAILLYLERVNFVVGGCGTGQGFLNAVMQYPGVFCGLVLTPLDAWLFAQINGGNCVSLALNQGYGWASDVNLRFVFDRLFEVEFGQGYPSHRQEPQRQSRETLVEISTTAHRTWPEIIKSLPDHVLLPAITYPGILRVLDVDSIRDRRLREAFQIRLR